MALIFECNECNKEYATRTEARECCGRKCFPVEEVYRCNACGLLSSTMHGAQVCCEPVCLSGFQCRGCGEIYELEIDAKRCGCVVKERKKCSKCSAENQVWRKVCVDCGAKS